METNLDQFSPENVKTYLSKVDEVQQGVKDSILSLSQIIILFFGVIGLVILLLQLHIIWRINRVATWPITKLGGTVVASYVEDRTVNTSYSVILLSQGYSAQAYRCRASFLYKVNGQEYLSNRISYYESWSDNPMVAYSEKAYLHDGRKIDIYVNPDNPREAYAFNKHYDDIFRLGVSGFLASLAIYAVLPKNMK